MSQCCAGKKSCGPPQPPASPSAAPPKASASACCGPTGGSGAATCGPTSADDTRKGVSEYYGETLQRTSDLKTAACLSPAERPSLEVRRALAKVHDEVHERYYGCGLVVPEVLRGCSVLDLGCGAGRDVYVLSQMVGAEGAVAGVDMTPAQLAVARKHVDYHTKAFGYDKPNVSFVEGTLEELDTLGLTPGSYDVAVSNCVINLVTDKERVLRHTYNLLKEGGEFYFSDVYASRRIPEALTRDKVLYGECISGALYYNDFEAMARRVGFADPRIVHARAFGIDNAALAAKVEGYSFYSVTYRLFKDSALEAHQEDYGQAAMYKGTVTDCDTAYALDLTHVFETGRIVPVSGNTARMLQHTRLAPHFEVFESKTLRHFGPFAAHRALTVPEAARLDM